MPEWEVVVVGGGQGRVTGCEAIMKNKIEFWTVWTKFVIIIGITVYMEKLTLKFTYDVDYENTHEWKMMMTL